LQIAENSHWCDVFNLTLKSVSFHRGESSSYILLSALERIIFSFFVGSIPLDPSLMQSLEDGQAFIDLLTNTKCSKRNHFQTVRNWKQWRSVIEGTSTFYSKNCCWVCGIYTVGQMWLRWPSDQPLVFSSQFQSLINQTSGEKYSNHKSSPARVIQEENIEKYGFAPLWMLLPLT